ncbi:histone-fold-containing protein [Coniochaeta ligniaria NRRL 30616]|uniref:Histone H4 n=1 Tax=Coniochaeta ligniaria NRRL 30616 TaxID=1408157 RepID=A0A1J7IWW4_9PEZI|nr:histone-fold-containing protein [Coniochaeta ligniaria NRRL 30616]
MPPTTAPMRGGPGGKGRAVPQPGRGSGVGGKSLGKSNLVFGGKRHRKIPKDCIQGISKPDIRRLARRGGVKRISAMIYNDVRLALKQRLERILHDCIAYVEHRKAKTVTIHDVIHALQRLGRPIYGFDPDTYTHNAAAKKRRAQIQRGNDDDSD